MLNLNRDTFFLGVRREFYGGKLTQGTVDGITAILDACEQAIVTSRRQLAYILATAYHETAKTMQPVEEYGKGRGRKYGSKIRLDGKPYKEPNHLYYGRGHIQLTWLENYERIGGLLRVNLLHNPALALDTRISARILVEGMLKGWFTGKKLSQYINNDVTDYKSARKIVNGTDKADLIAGYAQRFFNIIEVAAK